MATLRDIKRRIKSVKNTQQITKAMEMVAAAKLRRAQARVLASRPYARGMEEMLANLAEPLAELRHPLFVARPVERRALFVFASNRGLAGSYNANVLRLTEGFLRSEEGPTLRLVLLGRKLNDYFRRRSYPVLERYTDLPDEASLATARQITQRALDLFLSGEVDAVDLVYSQYVSAMTRRVVRRTLLPIVPAPGPEPAAARGTGAGMRRDYLFEPDAEALAAKLLPRYATTRLLQAFSEAFASEHSARMLAMGAARKNAGEMIDMLVLRRNRLRQAAITKEISEIVGGAEALK